MDAPTDLVYVTGPVEFGRTTTVDASGLYEYHERLDGHLTVTPVDGAGNLVGTPYRAVIGDLQQGSTDPNRGWVLSELKQLAPQKGGTQMLMTKLKVGTAGKDSYTAQEQCP
jgi:hypothetical protein